jgi:hypothetical protein
MDAGSSRAGWLWRWCALVFALSVVAVRLGMAGCTPSVSPATPAGGGTSNASTPAAATAPEAESVSGKGGGIREPEFFAPTKAGGGFYEPPSEAAEQQAPAPQAPAPQESPKPRPTSSKARKHAPGSSGR